MNVQGSLERILDSVLPHEITHTIFATHFGRPLPRWADEGACTTVEHSTERRKQEQLLIQFLTSNRGIAFVPQSTGIASGQTDIFSFTVNRADLVASTVLWNNATAGAASGRMDMRSNLCYTLPASAQTVGQEPRTGWLLLTFAAFVLSMILLSSRMRGRARP